MARRTALIIEDEQDMRELLESMLAAEFEVVTAANGAEGVRLAKERRPTVILMDLVMPSQDGFSTCQVLRSSLETEDVPVIVVSGQNDEAHRTRAFQEGADDFIAKPFTRAELLARVAAKVRRPGRGQERKSLSFGDLTLDLLKLQVREGSEQIPVSVLEFRLLKFFVENADRVLSRAEILEAIWKDSVVSDRTVDTHIASLRRKIPALDSRLSTVYGAGYMLKR